MLFFGDVFDVFWCFFEGCLVFFKGVCGFCRGFMEFNMKVCGDFLLKDLGFQRIFLALSGLHPQDKRTSNI